MATATTSATGCFLVLRLLGTWSTWLNSSSSHRTLSSCIVNTSRIVNSCASLGSLFQCIIDPITNTIFFVHSKAFPWKQTMVTAPCLTMMHPCGESTSTFFFITTIFVLEANDQLFLSLIFSRLSTNNTFNFPSHVKFLNLVIIRESMTDAETELKSEEGN